MEKIEKIFNNSKGIIVFYIIVAILAVMLTKTINNVNNNSTSQFVESESYYA